jgi:signal transduction histidine kinase
MASSLLGMGVDLARRHRIAVERLALRRLPLAIVVLILFLATSLPIELYYYPGRLGPYLAVYAVELVVSLAAWVAARRRRRQARAVATAWAAAMALCICSYYPLVDGDAAIAIAALICLIAAMPAMLPFDARHQLAFASVAALGFFGIVAWGVPASLPWPYLFVAYVAVVVVCTIGADSATRTRWEAAEREASLHHTQEHLRLALARAEAAVAMRSRLVANVSHELRTPLNVIVGYADMMIDTPADAPLVAETAGRVRAQAVLLEALISDLLDMSRLSAGRVDVTIEEIDVEALLADVADRTRLLVRGRPITVAVECGVERCRTDPRRLGQILTNLVTNAAKFTRAGRITISARRRGERVEFAVADTGCGIPPGMHDAIFHAFEQVSPSRDGTRGIGLGLAIVQQLTDLLGGTVSVTSEVGMGATFTVSLPAGGLGRGAGRRTSPAQAPGAVPSAA